VTCQVQGAGFVEYFSGNKLLPGSETAAHCYAGHQFGHFSGQLGDGAAIYLGEVHQLQHAKVALALALAVVGIMWLASVSEGHCCWCLAY